MECDALPVDGRRVLGGEGFEFRCLGGKDLADVFRERGDALCLVRVGGIPREEMAVIPDRDTATAGGADDCFGPAFDMGPPCVDIAPHKSQRFIPFREMQ